ncbi:hypothetical protein [Paenibacillus lignilyticus]|uniref:Uncharacterized protein n=1 Tax=Paenibacillus lignilyticus TaxID=1172615 RepID=A0ABS5C7J1_9BACL|nr:hypothetical protein [Paenibacillus lignilyticus]MBP3961915.1 hypothetical protein [Paenibacillus lignilyticus]
MRPRYLVFPILVLIGGLCWYFNSPKSAEESIIKLSGDIQTIYYDDLNDGVVKHNWIELQTKDQQELMDILESVSYYRRLGSTNIRNDGKALVLTIVTKDKRNVQIDINEHGYVVRDNKKYQANSLLYDRLYDWLGEAA